MGQILTGILIFLFGLTIGGIGLATAGVGIGIPMIPLGIYFIVRGSRDISHKGATIGDNTLYEPKKIKNPSLFEGTKLGGICFGILLVFIGTATSALIIGIPILLVGIVLVIYNLLYRTNRAN